jgi:signal transduction histidine kinase
MTRLRTRVRTPASGRRLRATQHRVAATEPSHIDAPRGARLVRHAAMVAIYYAAALRLTDAFISGAVFPRALATSSAILLSALLVTPWARWWSVLSATLLVHWIASSARGVSSLAIFASFAMSALTAAAVAAVSRRFIDVEAGLGRLRAMTLFLSVALTLPFASVAPAIWLGFDASLGVRGSSNGWATWLVASLGYALAFFTVTPVALAGYESLRRGTPRDHEHTPPGQRLNRVALLSAAIAALSFVALGAPPVIAQGALAVIAPLPLVIYAAARLGVGGAAWALLLVAGVALHHATRDSDPVFDTTFQVGVLSLQLLSVALGAPLLLLGAVAEERRRFSQGLAGSRERYQLAARVGRVFVVSGGPDGGVTEPDSALASLLGIDPLEMERPDFWSTYVHPEDRARLRAQWSAVSSDATPGTPLDFRVIARDGRVYWLRRHAVLRGTAAEGWRPLVVLSDVSALRAAEQAAEQRNRELAHVARTATVGELAAALAHEVRQPLTAILVNSQTASRLLDSRAPDLSSVRDILHQLAEDSRRAGDVIQRIRTFARKGEPQRGPLDLNAAIRDAVQLARHEALRRRVTVHTALSHGPLIVVGDRVQLQQVALNLLLNALDAVSECENASERIVDVESQRSGPHTAMFIVRDTGPGVAIDRREAIFAPFVTSKSHGLGMGLAVSRTIVEAHGGIIWCDRAPSGGAAFMVAIPLDPSRP